MIMDLFRAMYLLAANVAVSYQRRQRNLERQRVLRRNRLAADAYRLRRANFVKTYRLSKELVGDLIEELRPHMPVERRRDSMDAGAKVLVALAFFASGSYQALVGQSICHAVSQPSVSRAVRQVTAALNRPEIFHKYVSFPLTNGTRNEVQAKFITKFGIPGVVGVIDGTHVSLIKPSEREEAYYCRKGYHSLNVMIICDSDLNILCVDPSAPGSSHDSVVWRNHPLNNYLNNLNEACFLLGDSGYPLRENLMTPILHANEETPEAHYYKMHVTARNVVERTIGVLKARFRCLLVARQLHYKPEIAAKIVNACSVLHNIANHARLPVPDLTEQEQEAERAAQMHVNVEDEQVLRVAGPAGRGNEPLARGRARQRQLVQILWANR